jgi:tRNA pseudouridine13 synthase
MTSGAKLRCLPDDFQVEEITRLAPRGGRFAFYQLRKQNLGTPEAVAAIARRWRLPPRAIAFGGLKDKHAVTTQHLTIEDGPRQSLAQTNLSLDYLGQVDRPFHASDIVANRFQIALRDLEPRRASTIAERLSRLAAIGVANYYDDQRFGSLGASGQFIARAWVDRDYERACHLALCDPTDSDRPDDRLDRERIAAAWGQWDALARHACRDDRRAVLEELCRSNNFRRAFVRIAHPQRSLYLSAYQGFLWNELLAEQLGLLVPPAQVIAMPLKAGRALLYRELDSAALDALRQLAIPLPSSRIAPVGPIAELIERVLGRHQITLKKLRVDYPRDSFFSKGERAAIVFPAERQAAEEPDPLHPARSLARLQFQLPRGAYATMVVKSLLIG